MKLVMYLALCYLVGHLTYNLLWNWVVFSNSDRWGAISIIVFLLCLVAYPWGFL